MNNSSKVTAEKIWCRGCCGEKMSSVGRKDGYELLRCGDCKTVIVNPYPSEAELMAYYNASHKDHNANKKSNKQRRALRRMKRMLRQGIPGKKFLDIGCHVGYVVEAACQLGLEAYGIDIDAAAILTAQKNAHPSACYETISIQDLAKRGVTFDAIYMSEVIEHVRDPEEMIALTSKLLNKGGLLYLTAPDAGHFGVPRDFLKWPMVCPPQHLTLFTRRGIEKLFSRHGLTVEKYQLALKPGMKVFVRKS